MMLPVLELDQIGKQGSTAFRSILGASSAPQTGLYRDLVRIRGISQWNLVLTKWGSD